MVIDEIQKLPSFMDEVHLMIAEAQFFVARIGIPLSMGLVRCGLNRALEIQIRIRPEAL
jgi:hypothetical protein